jgi:hypothetical protein
MTTVKPVARFAPFVLLAASAVLLSPEPAPGG